MSDQDICERLLNPPYCEHDGQRLVLDSAIIEPLLREAAEEIKRLRDRLDADDIVDYPD